MRRSHVLLVHRVEYLTLREMTGVGMMDCKKALAEADGNMDKAVEILREKGLAASQKKAGRIAAEGMAYISFLFPFDFHLSSFHNCL